ncbi:MAG: hypothetical protein IPL40_07755 [Proteobacteria bacterium]|nr:hypothetical protein [Pseudomonadota bacterium]
MPIEQSPFWRGAAAARLVLLFAGLAAGCSSQPANGRDASSRQDGGADRGGAAQRDARAAPRDATGAARDATAATVDQGGADARLARDGSAADAPWATDAARPDAGASDGAVVDGGAADQGAFRCEDHRPVTLAPTHARLPAGALRATQLAGDGQPGQRDGVAGQARFSEPRGLAADDQGALYVSECQNQLIRRLQLSSAMVTTVAGSAGLAGAADGPAGSARFRCPSDLVVLGGSLYVADTDNGTIRRVELGSGQVTTLAGAAGEHASADGALAEARFDHPGGITGHGQSLWVADTGNQVIRHVDLSAGTVITVAGAAGLRGRGDGLKDVSRLSGPRGLGTDGLSLYIADSGNNAVRRLDLASGRLSTIAGGGAPFGYQDGAWNAALFFSPSKVAVDGVDLWVSDTNNRVVRRLDLQACTVGTPAGAAGLPGNSDGLGQDARFSWTDGVARVSEGVVVVDMLTHALRLLAAP